MTPGLMTLCAAALTATVASIAVYLFESAAVNTWVRRVALVLFNLSPWTIGFWRSSFTRRETAFAAWFLVFINHFARGRDCGPTLEASACGLLTIAEAAVTGESCCDASIARHCVAAPVRLGLTAAQLYR
jgi:hypothetical protein